MDLYPGPGAGYKVIRSPLTSLLLGISMAEGLRVCADIRKPGLIKVDPIPLPWGKGRGAILLYFSFIYTPPF